MRCPIIAGSVDEHLNDGRGLRDDTKAKLLQRAESLYQRDGVGVAQTNAIRLPDGGDAAHLARALDARQCALETLAIIGVGQRTGKDVDLAETRTASRAN